MKNTIILLLLATVMKGQITFSHSYPAPAQYSNLGVLRLTHSGDKYALYNFNINQVVLYNTNHSVWKTLSLPVPNGFKLYSVLNISDALFDSDTDLEVFYSYWVANYTTSPASYTTEARVIEENATPLMVIGNCRTGTINKVGNNWKLIANIDSAGKATYISHNVYDLVGSLPVVTSMQGAAEGVVVSQPYPNPSSDKAIIAYQLPEGTNVAEIIVYDIKGIEIKSYRVDSTFNTLELDNSDLPSGTYFYQLKAGTNSGSKKMVVIK